LATASASLARLEIDGGLARHFRDRQRGALAHRDHGLAAQQHARDRLIARRHRVVDEDVVPELEWLRCERDARDGDATLERRDDARLHGLCERKRRPKREERNQCGGEAGNVRHVGLRAGKFRSSDRDCASCRVAPIIADSRQRVNRNCQNRNELRQSDTGDPGRSIPPGDLAPCNGIESDRLSQP